MRSYLRHATESTQSLIIYPIQPSSPSSAVLAFILSLLSIHPLYNHRIAAATNTGDSSWSSIPRAGLCSPVLSTHYLIPSTQSPAPCYTSTPFVLVDCIPAESLHTTIWTTVKLVLPSPHMQAASLRTEWAIEAERSKVVRYVS